MTRRRSIGGERSRAASRWVKSPAGTHAGLAAESSEAAEASKPPSARTSRLAGPGLYLVATPIGNAADITLRALDVLARADVIACEDTRVTAKLLAVHGISRPLVRYDEHTARAAGPTLIERVGRGECVALVSDAGTPSISDPGERLVRDCIDAGLPVLAVPGASAALTALCVSGLPAGALHVRRLPSAAQALRAAASCRNSRMSRRRWCCWNRRNGWPRRSPTWRTCWARAMPPSRAS